ncbi:hypothetical protein TSYNTROOL_16030 [Tepidanaerobacter syntrophicus]|uniref:hypothetical protein n=1 Tax=Tepidanaerobacter syntrophicus TaxID=224999 RepID=UPI0022EEDC57|nr:hypothetical protein [Tepidanaerobacter syntrophicus]GLI51517.1 hypothetical protein TSYNTROOL_16030 [Tepidanaerobacter syntrophicus]
MLWKLIERRGLYGENSLVMDKSLPVEEKIFKLLEGDYTYPEFEKELKEALSDLGKDVCQDVLKFLCIDNIL